MAKELPAFYADVCSELGVTDPSNTASAEDRSLVETAYPAIWALLYESSLVDYDVDSAIPDKYALPVTWVTAYHLAERFGIAGDKLIRLRMKGSLELTQPSDAERLLRKMASVDYIPSVATTEDF